MRFQISIRFRFQIPIGFHRGHVGFYKFGCFCTIPIPWPEFSLQDYMLVQLPPCAEGKQALVQLLWASYKMCRDYPCYYKAAEWSAFWCSQSPDSEDWARWVAHRHFKQDDSAYVRSKLCLEVHSDCACFCILTIIDQTLRRSKYGGARFLQISHFQQSDRFHIPLH